MPPRRLLIFLKYPTPGRVKTRLAAQLGPDEAARIYRDLAERQVREAVCVKDTQAFAFYDPPEMKAAVARWLAPWAGLLCPVPQGEGDLGARMRQAFEQVFREGTSPTVIIGTDCPRLGRAVLEEAFALLAAPASPDLVLGPATDGGYYLLGMKQLHASLFEAIPWSTPAVLADTLAAARRSGLTWILLPELGDVDTAEDLKGMEL